MKTAREREIAKARRVLGDDRLLVFLRGCREPGCPRACGFVNDQIEKGEGLDSIFYTGDPFGYRLAVAEVSPNTFRVDFGYQAGPEAGDGGRWIVTFNSDGSIESSTLGEMWIS